MEIIYPYQVEVIQVFEKTYEKVEEVLKISLSISRLDCYGFVIVRIVVKNGVKVL